MLLTLLSVATVALIQPRAGLRADSSTVRRFIDHVRHEELNFLAAWRREWRSARDLAETNRRYGSLHCHFDEPLRAVDRFHLIRTPYSRKSMCPIWFEERGERADETENIDNGIPQSKRAKIRERRASVIRLLDSAAALAPGDLWVMGQRVRLNVDQREYERALSITTAECDRPGAVCPLLEGYVLASEGHTRSAAATFEYAVRQMTPAERCAYLDISSFVPWHLRDSYDRCDCGERAALSERFWWLADPLFAEPGNERLSIHLYRTMLVALRSALTADEHVDWRLKYGGAAAADMLIRYGWPNVSWTNRREDEDHNGWLGWHDQAVNSSREYFPPRYRTTPPYEAAADISTLTAASFSDVAAPWDEGAMAPDRSWWPIEHIARAAPIGPMDFQVATFRREHAPLVVLAADPNARVSGKRAFHDSELGSYSAALVSMKNREATPRSSVQPAAIGSGGAVVMSLETTAGWQVVSGELLNLSDSSATSTRARLPLTAPDALDSLLPGEVAFSDPALFIAGRDSLPKSSADAFARMLPSTTLHDPERLGVYFEIYGLPEDATTELTLAVVSLDQPGLLRRLGARFGIADAAGGAIAVRWRANNPGSASGVERSGSAVIHTRSMVLNVSLLKPGRYSLEISMDGYGAVPIVTQRELRIVR